jgi:diguanylate cyclase (GGDEF)-like protein
MGNDALHLGGRGRDLDLTQRRAHDRNRPCLFILSPDHRDELAALARALGWRAIAARRQKDAGQRYYLSEAQIAIVDARGAERPETMAELLARPVEACAGGLLVLLDAGMESAVPALIGAGASHYLCGDIDGPRLAAALASAGRFADRLNRATDSDATIPDADESLSWRFDRRRGRVALSERLAQRLDPNGAELSPRALLRKVPGGDRGAALAAIRRVSGRGGTAAFAHALPGEPGKRAAHHLTSDRNDIIGEIELLPGTGTSLADMRDRLTGLHNRQAALRWLSRELESGGNPMVLLVSIGQFDHVNIAYGPVAGDALLGRLARRINRLVEDIADGEAITARMAGTDFLIGLSTADATVNAPERAKFLARRVIAALARPFALDGQLIRLTGRCGIAEPRKGDDAMRLLRRAGAALVEARQSGRGGIRIVTANRNRQDVDADRLESDLRLALTRGEIEIVFQPQYAMAGDHMLGVEALARWRHPEYGMLGAGVLFAAAGRSDYLGPLSGYIHGEALRIASCWPAALSGLRLSVNVTAADIAQPDFPARFLALADTSGFSRERLTVEVTESELIENLEDAAVLLAELRTAGLKIAVDDFGTGYSSLAYLKTLPADYLKIDSGLTQDIGAAPRDAIIVRSIIQMARSLGLGVIAEGVETEQQRTLLAAEGCDVYQGFLRSPALSADALAACFPTSGR